MESKWFIVSSKQFRDVMHELNPDAYEKHDDIVLIGEGSKVFFENLPERKLDVEMRNPPFKLYLTPKQVRKFYRVLGMIEEQPLTIIIDGNSYINFHAVV